jgi:hypothetical protein
MHVDLWTCDSPLTDAEFCSQSDMQLVC